MTPEDMDRVLARDAEGVRASPRFAAAVMAAVRREAKAPPPIPFPWTRAVPGIAAALLLVVFAVVPLVSRSPAETPPRASVAFEHAVEITTRVGDSLATLDARWASIWVVVAALTVVPILAPLLIVSPERDSQPGDPGPA